MILSSITFPSSECSSKSNMTRWALLLSLNARFLGRQLIKTYFVFFNSWFALHLITQQLLDTALFFVNKSEMTRRQLPAIQTQWRGLDSPPPPPPPPPRWAWFSDYDMCRSVSIPTLAIVALDYLNYIFAVFGPSVQVRMKTTSV